MSGVGGIAAVILAAGRSSRMGGSKPRLPVGSVSVLERVVGTVVRAKVDDVVVVTGHEPDGLTAVLAGLPVRRVHNPGYDAGMFSSVKTGVAALPGDVEAFFVLPADHPLIRVQVLERLLAAFHEGRSGILHPTCCGRRGHPVLIAGRYREALLRADDTDDLRSFLSRHAADEAEVETEDLTILMDMDTTDDYHRACRLAASLDAADSAGGLLFEDALCLLSLMQLPRQVVAHCHTVAGVAASLAQAVKPFAPQIDVDLARVAGLLHDMARTYPKHPDVGRKLLGNLGLSRLGDVVGAHMVLPPEQVDAAGVTEEQLVYLADKLVVDDQVGDLEARAARMKRDWGDRPLTAEVLRGMETRMRVAATIQEKVESMVDRPLSEVLPR